ncbi:MAG: reverse transcriptase domain-containing protein [Rhodothermales bacterium]
MKRSGHLFNKIVSLDNLLIAARKAFRGKKDKPRVAAFYFNLENEGVTLHQELIAATYEPRPYRTFTIFEPKERQICAADFRDRVVHHAICHMLDPLFEKSMISDTFACRVNKGTHAAVNRAQYFARRFPVFLKCDVVKYFASVDQAVLRNLLCSKIKDRRLLALLDQIIDHPLPGSSQGKGLPIGNLTSQYFANFYLGKLDHFVKDQMGVKGYVRYMDDFILFGESKYILKEQLLQIREYLENRLLLKLKDHALLMAPVAHGIPFLGFRIFPHLVRLDGRKWSKFRAAVRKREEQYMKGEIDEDELARSVLAMIGHVQHANTHEARKKFFAGSAYLG